MNKKRLSLITSALLLAGCAVGPLRAPESGFQAPARWQLFESSEQAQLPDWAGLLDPELAALQTRALEANRDIAQALLRLQAADRQLQAAGLALQPQPSLSGSASGQRLLESGGRTQRSFGLSAGLGYEADLWQRLSSLQRAQAAQREGAQTDVAAARLLIRSEVAQRYWSLASLQAERPLLQTQLEIAEEALKLTRLRVQEGKLLPIEIDKAGATLQQLRLGLAQNQEQQQLQRLQLGLLLDQTSPVLPETARLPAGLTPDWRLQSPEQALARRPDVQQARWQVDAALQRLRASEAARYPSLSFSLGVGTGGSRWQDWLQNPLASLSANLVVPLVDWRRLDLQRDDARGELDSAALRLRDSLHKALVEIEQLAAEQQRLRASEAANRARLDEAAATERLAALRMEVGAIGRLDWLQARNARLAAEQENLRLRLAAWLNQAALHRALAS